MKVRKAVIPAAGLGTRFLPATKAQPKEMLPIIDKPVIQFVVEDAVAAGIEDILIVTSRNKGIIEDHFDHSFELNEFLKKKGKHDLIKQLEDISNLAEIHFIRQKEPLGLGHAIYCAREHIGNNPFVVMLGDDFYISKVPQVKQLIDAFERLGGSILGVKEVPKEETSRYGIINGEKIDDKTMLINDVIEKPGPEKAPSNIAWMGRAVMTPEIFDFLRNIKPGYGGEIQFVDAVKEMCKTHKIFAFNYEGKRYDIGTKLDYLKAIIDYAMIRKDLNGDFKKYLRGIKI
jgi:UTP--glucose-1-phosphate uridylyltransferase